LPLTELVSFKTRLQRGNRIQLPKLVRWKYKLEIDQILKVYVTVENSYINYETFYARMDKSGRITINRLTLNLLERHFQESERLTGAVMNVRLEPT
jgi:bifunctional DNA-binding transcriptional regulator/antitoxin component of YhaV-PrlF toxin-antitoxin module